MAPRRFMTEPKLVRRSAPERQIGSDLTARASRFDLNLPQKPTNAQFSAAVLGALGPVITSYRAGERGAADARTKGALLLDLLSRAGHNVPRTFDLAVSQGWWGREGSKLLREMRER